MLTIGKRMTWDDIVKQYPDKWWRSVPIMDGDRM